MKKLPKNSIPLIITSPPYNLRNTASNWVKTENCGLWTPPTYDEHYDAMPHDEYVGWQREFITEALRVLKPDGAMFYNHKWRVQAGRLQERYDITDDFPVRQIIIWHRKGGINFNKTYFLPTYEVLYLFAGPKFKLENKAIGYTDVWQITPERKNPHPAPFPVELPKKCIKATGANLVLDPFAGSGTTAVAAEDMGINWICIEKSKNYCSLAHKRITKTQKR